MKSKENKRFFKIIRKVTMSFFAVLLILVLPLTSLKKEDISVIYGVFVGKKSEYQGMIEIWNIDTFESGKSSKSSFLSYAANVFQKDNKGLYFMIRNVTEQELVYLLESGERPDLFSCSYGVACMLENYIKPYTSNFDIKQEFLDAGKLHENQYGVAWAYSKYILISTKEKLEEAKVDLDGVSLAEIALSSGYEKVGKKKNKTIYSLSVGHSKYLLPEIAFSSYNKSEVSVNKNFAVNLDNLNQSQYLAYSRFISGESVILLGSLRDVFRMENRVLLGKVANVIYESLGNFTDLVQFMFLCDGREGNREKVAVKFTEFLVQNKVQSQLSKLGMLSPLKNVKIDFENSVISDIVSENIENYILNNVFISNSEITVLREKYKLI